MNRPKFLEAPKFELDKRGTGTKGGTDTERGTDTEMGTDTKGGSTHSSLVLIYSLNRQKLLIAAPKLDLKHLS